MDQPLAQSAAEDFDLLARAHQGDALALRCLVTRLSPAAHRLAWRMLGDAALAEDMVQEGLEKLFRSRQYQGAARLSTYFHTMISRLCLDHLRSQDPVQFDSDLADECPVTDPGPGPEQAAQRGQQTSRVQQAIGALPPRQRLAISLWAYQDSSVLEIAQALGLERNAADQILHRAKANLKKLLEVNHEPA